ncbi:MAG TPA: hypothetical protein VGL72_07590 [Bryobacteraceae bacterium]|jgi:hypothetical protein
MRFSVLLLLLAAAFPAAGDPADAYVRVSPQDRRYLELTDGTPYLPIGLNMIGPPDVQKGEAAALAGMDDWLTKLSSNGGNYIRVWLSNPFWAVEHEKSGEYDEARAKRIDQLLAMCRRHGIRAKLTMEHFRSIGGGRQSWADEPFRNVANGGTATSMADFLDGEASRAQFKRKIEWYRQRIGERPEIYGWELWNEINAVGGGDYMAWTRLMLPELHRAFPRNMAMQSLGSFDSDRVRERYRELSTMEGNDVAQVHRYLDLGAALEVCHGPVDILAADAVREVLRFHPDRPVILAESGAVEPKHAGPFKLYAADHEGMLLHDILFAPFFAGAAGAGQIWHWDVYVAANNLWFQFGRFAQAVKGLDPRTENFQPMMVDHDRLRVYVLRGRHTTLAWCRDSKNTWESELKNGVKPERLRDVKVDLSNAVEGRKPASVRFYDPWADRWSDGKMKNGQLKLPEFSRSIVIRVSDSR